MLTTIYIILIVVLLMFTVLCGFAMITSDSKAVMRCLMFGFVTGCFIFVPIKVHINDIATIEFSEKYIEMREEAIVEIDKQISTFNPSSALLNADTPYASLMETKAKFVDDITNEKVKVLDAKKSIYERERGFTAFATWLVD